MGNLSGKEKALVEVRAVFKQGHRDADLRDLTFIFPQKSSYGILGSRYSGRSSLLRMIYCSAIPDKGDVEVFGLNTRNNDIKIKRLIGIVPNFYALEDDLTVIDQMRVFGFFYDLSRPAVRNRTRELLQQLELTDIESQVIRKLSEFQKKKLSIAKALIHSPKALVLDDITLGLSKKDQHWIWEQLFAIKQSGCSLIVSSSNPFEVERLCDEAILLHKGAIVGEGKPRVLIDSLIGTRVIDFECSSSDVGFYFNKFSTEYEVFASGNHLRVYLKGNQDPRALQNQISSDSVLTRRPNLEDVYFKTTGHLLESGWHNNLSQ